MALNGTVHERGDSVPRPFIIGVAGGTASGKTSVCACIMHELGQDQVSDRARQVAIISEDSFYRMLSAEEKEEARKGEFNFDHPDAIDFDQLLRTIRNVRAGKQVEIPKYDFVNSMQISGETQVIHPTVDVVLFEGILSFYWPQLREMYNMKLFVDQDADTRLARRVVRDTKERGRDIETVLHQYTHCVKPAFEEFCLPTKKYADVIIPRGKENEVAINLIVQHIKDLLQPGATARGIRRPRYNSDSAAIHQRPH